MFGKMTRNLPNIGKMLQCAAMNPSGETSPLDLAVLLVFWARPQTLARCFARIRQARPARLYLYQDGAPPDAARAAGHTACRDFLADAVDWPCEVFRRHEPENRGPWDANARGIRWMFAREEAGVILEDDDIVEPSFFPFAAELLRRYRDDERIGMIAGMNHERATRTDASYLFTRFQSIWGWASWKRVVEAWDETYSWLDDPERCARFRRYSPAEYAYRRQVSEACRATGRMNYEMLSWAVFAEKEQVNIVPAVNLVSNVGVGEGTGHFGALREEAKGIQKLMLMPTQPMGFPLVHPAEVAEDARYTAMADRALAFGHPWVERFRRIERSLRRFWFAPWPRKLEKIGRLASVLRWWRGGW